MPVFKPGAVLSENLRCKTFLNTVECSLFVRHADVVLLTIVDEDLRFCFKFESIIGD